MSTQTIIIFGSAHTVAPSFQGFAFKECNLSKNVAAIGTNDKTKELFVQYRNGGKYLYSAMPTEKLQAAMMATSIGSFIHAEVKDKHDFIKVNEDVLVIVEKDKKKPE